MNWMQSALAGLCGTPTSRRLVILSYHRVLERYDPLLAGEPTAAAFDAQLSFIEQYLRVLPLPEAVERLRSATLPQRAACITFDDGYRNNYEIAAPLLERRGMSATFFIATGAIEEGAMWNDLIIETVRRSAGTLDLRAFDLDCYDIGSDAARGRVVLDILEAMKYLPFDERRTKARRIYTAHVGDGLPSMMMSAEMIHRLACKGHDVGAHTVGHPILATIEPEQARREVIQSRDWVTQVTGRLPVSFAYPNGRIGVDFEPLHRTIVQQAGFKCAVSTEWGCASPRTDLFALPRLTPWETTRFGFVTRIAKSYVQSYRPPPTVV